MPITVAVAGKGGTGKTTLSGLIIRSLVESGKKPVLAVDADPDNNLHEVLGVDCDRTVVSVVEELLAGKDNLPPGMTKAQCLELSFQEALSENSGFDLLSMGHPEREGCYCAANNMLRKCVEELAANYPFTVMDNEAGMEHLSRRTARKVDFLLIAANPTAVSLKSAARIKAIASELSLDVKKTFLVLNEMISSPQAEPAAAGMEVLGRIPRDEELPGLGFGGKSVFSLPENSPALLAARELTGRLAG